MITNYFLKSSTIHNLCQTVNKNQENFFIQKYFLNNKKKTYMKQNQHSSELNQKNFIINN